MRGNMKFTNRELNALLGAVLRAEAGEPETDDEDVEMYPRLADKLRKELVQTAKRHLETTAGGD